MSLAYKISAYNRNRKWDNFNNEFNIKSDIRILDVGFSEEEYSETDNYIEKKYPYLNRLTALGIDFPINFKKRYADVDVVSYGGKIFPFKDKAFDILWSNAVIEHVGDIYDQIRFIKEVKRVSRCAYITTPNKNFPIEVHTRTPLIHYFPKNIFEKYLVFMGKEWATGGYMNLLTEEDIKYLLSEADIDKYKIIKNRLLGFVLDYSIIVRSE